jgi:hypothetical protein
MITYFGIYTLKVINVGIFLFQNVCCDDGLHCCHVGTVCDPLHYVCIPYPSSAANWTHSWTEMTPAQRLPPLDAPVARPAVAVEEVVMESDKQQKSTCLDDHTCCVDKAGRNGRCILDGVSRTWIY